MDEREIPKGSKREKSSYEDAEEVEKLLAVVIKRRKTVPAKCLELMKETAATEILQLEKAKVYVQENKDKENFKNIFQSLKRFKSFQFSYTDLNEAETKIKKFGKKTAELNAYLQRRKQLLLLD